MGFWNVEGANAYAVIAGTLTIIIKGQTVVRTGTLAYTFSKHDESWKIDAQRGAERHKKWPERFLAIGLWLRPPRQAFDADMPTPARKYENRTGTPDKLTKRRGSP